MENKRLYNTNNILDPVINEGSGFKPMIVYINITRLSITRTSQGTDTHILRVTNDNKKYIAEALNKMEPEERLFKPVIGYVVKIPGYNAANKFIRYLYEAEKNDGVDLELPDLYLNAGFKRYKIGGLLTYQMKASDYDCVRKTKKKYKK